MSDISDIWQGQFAGVVVPYTSKIMKNVLEFLERGEDLLQNSVLKFAIRLSQSPVIAFQNWNLHR